MSDATKQPKRAKKIDRPMLAGIIGSYYSRGQSACALCLHWDKPSNTCRRLSPSRKQTGVAAWPRTSPTDYCSQFNACGLLDVQRRYFELFEAEREAIKRDREARRQG